MEEVSTDRNRFKQQLDLTCNDKQNLDKAKSSLAQQLDELASEVEKLKLANSSLQKTRDQLEDEKDDIGLWIVCFSLIYNFIALSNFVCF